MDIVTCPTCEAEGQVAIGGTTVGFDLMVVTTTRATIHKDVGGYRLDPPDTEVRIECGADVPHVFATAHSRMEILGQLGAALHRATS